MINILPKSLRYAFLGAGLTASAISTAHADNTNTVSILSVNCAAKTGEEMQVMMDNYAQVTAQTLVTDLNGNVHVTHQPMAINKTIEGLSRAQLEQLAQTAGEDEGQNVYARALNMLIEAEEECFLQNSGTVETLSLR